MASRVARRTVLLAVLPVVLLIAASVRWPGRPQALAVMQASAVPAIITCAGLLAIVAALAVVCSRPDTGAEVVDEEEPLLHSIRFRLGTRERPVVGVIGLEPGCGASTIAYNLSTLVAVEGRARADMGTVRPLPICLLSDGALSARLGLSSATLAEYLRGHPGDLGEALESLPVRVASLLDLLCLPPERLGRGQLSRMISGFRRRYDAVVIECGAQDRFLAAALADEADLLILCAGPQVEGRRADLAAAAAGFLLGRENKTILLLNRQSGPARDDVLPEFAYRVELPKDQEIQHLDLAGKPWVLWPRSRAAERLREFAGRVLPRLFPEELSDAA